MDNFSIGGVTIKCTAFKPSFATTSTEDSDRTQDGEMHNTPMFSVEAYNVELQNVSLPVMASLMQAYLNKSTVSFHYLAPYTGTWKTKDFYITNSSMNCGKLTDDYSFWESCSFNIIGTHPLGANPS